MRGWPIRKTSSTAVWATTDPNPTMIRGHFASGAT